MKTFAWSLVFLGAVAAPSFAADLVSDVPLGETVMVLDRSQLAAEGFDWNGFYAGVMGGYVGGPIKAGATEVPVAGGMVGATAGYNAQFGSFVLGAEGDLAWTGAKGTATCVTAPAFSCNADVDWLGTVRGRAGVAFDKVLVFATGGVAVAGGKGTVTPTFPGTTSTFSDTFVGYTAGVGVELAITDALSVKAEYNYINLGSRVAPAGTLGTGATTVSPLLHTAKIGLNYHF